MSNITHIKLVSSAFFWGGSAIAGKIAMEMALPSAISFSRFALAAIFMLMMINKKSILRDIGVMAHVKLIAMGLLGVSLCYFFYFNGLYLSSAFNAGIIEATIPLATLAVSAAIGIGRLGPMQVGGFIVAYLGVCVTISNGNVNALIAAEFGYGDLLLLVSTLCFAGYNVLIGIWPLKLSSTVRMFYIFLYGAVGLLPWMLHDLYFYRTLYQVGESGGVVGIAAIFFMAAGGSVLAYLFFNQGIDEIGATKASSFINLVPLVTIVLSVLVLNESVGAGQWWGAAIILLGVTLSNRQAKPIFI